MEDDMVTVRAATGAGRIRAATADRGCEDLAGE
jgi:hypothetical protein